MSPSPGTTSLGKSAGRAPVNHMSKAVGGVDRVIPPTPDCITGVFPVGVPGVGAFGRGVVDLLIISSTNSGNSGCTSGGGVGDHGYGIIGGNVGDFCKGCDQGL